MTHHPRADRGLIIIDPLLNTATAKPGLELY